MALVALTTLVGSGLAVEPTVMNVEVIEHHLRAALRHNGGGDLDAALKSIRAASHCDSVEDAVPKQPIGIKTPRQIEFQLRMALREIRAGKWWRAAMLSQHMAGCYSVTLFEESMAAVAESRSRSRGRIDPDRPI